MLMLSTPNCPSGYVVDKMFALGRDCEVFVFLKSHSTYADAYYCVCVVGKMDICGNASISSSGMYGMTCQRYRKDGHGGGL